MNSVSLYLIAGAVQVVAIAVGVLAYRQQQHEAKSDKTEIISRQDSSTEKILLALREKNRSLSDSLWDKYPFGYVLFGGERGDFAALPFTREIFRSKQIGAKLKLL